MKHVLCLAANPMQKVAHAMPSPGKLIGPGNGHIAGVITDPQSHQWHYKVLATITITVLAE